jgi:peptidoglycan-associated lipoprotein
MKTTPQNFIRYGLIAVAAVTIAACGTREEAPAPQTQLPAPTRPQTQAPPVQQPAPQQPVQQAPAGQIRPGSTQDFVVNVGDRVYFDLDQYAVRTDARPVLDAQAAWLARYPSVTVRIEGNADERGTREYNLALGERRANAVRDYLVMRGVPTSRISIVSYGKERPIAEGSNEAAWQQNRNAHTAIISGAN